MFEFMEGHGFKAAIGFNKEIEVKKAILGTLIGLVSANAFASKARVASLLGAAHIIDTQTVFTNPAHLNKLNPFMTFEMGAQGSGAEGGFSRKLSSGNLLGVYLGHDNSNDLRDGSTFLKPQNPIEVTYGTGSMAFAGSLSTVDNKKTGTKETTFVAKFGSVVDDMGYFAHLALVSSAEKKGTPDQKINAAPVITLGGAKEVDTNYWYGQLTYGQAKTEAAATTNTKDTGLTLGWEDRSLKTNDNDIYYGAQLAYSNRDIEGKKITKMYLPVFVGMELNLSSWSVFRASLKQNVLVGSEKDETAANTDPDGINSNTEVAAGLGLKHNNLVLDGLLSAASSGQINGTAFLASAAVTYNF